MKVEELVITNPTKIYVMAFLHESPKSGYDLMLKFEGLLDKKLSPGQLYPLLKRMLDKGLVEFEVEYHGKRKKKIYRLTSAGKRECLELIKKLKGMKRGAMSKLARKFGIKL